MSIRVELYGIPRRRAGVEALAVDGQTLGEALAAAGRRLPVLNEVCLEGPRLRGGYLANRNGRTFVSDPATPLEPGDCVLILSADAGG
jgi:molybdopterin converting factor small subunit